MPDLSLIMLGAGTSSRFKTSVKKQWLRTEHTPLWLYATTNIIKNIDFEQVIIVCSDDEIEYMKLFEKNFTYVIGGNTRQESLKNALLHVKSQNVLVSDVARACIPQDMLQRIIQKDDDIDIVVPYLKVHDTVVYENETINRDKVKLIQTPQYSKTATLKKALLNENNFTDDSSAIKANGGKVSYVLGDKRANKITSLEDIEILQNIPKPSNDMFVGQGYDVHQFEKDKPMVLGGVTIKETRGFKAHSDGDVALHALIDALLGAAGAGDIGELFPDNDPAFKNADSKKLLKKVVSFLYKIGFNIVNCDITIMAQAPKLSPYKNKMRETIADILNIMPIHVNVKATTTEKLGFVGREEGVAVNATVTLKYYNWKNS
ncbi:bifunctional 2-C-methyl-D-erythritol 4-phosphate cytidylyltransferase/2-C-methyl-D-erythritol 2,4-cyclodiphosphate synthase [Sulfurospirillum arcachonense]|uniref:bifunctional 2-C-methyl-D-erythritol 4-phosphate cytidylyltransferase/2-C-methyl-D-erythritol 2,4-cyclodiphosphate synthase n=1 Tax=Sulfurospirillum arcachonense TaxID=57666 RepID=UPI00046A4ABC|nr:bifunctional 2-C-methyl-D-erythritol 4-phosphate cytidylyltransferase/2-C-methyl-D-erythritol 2,4-cyclodiphosphate synthase [Sulfurospirillum arcachonense]